MKSEFSGTVCTLGAILHSLKPGPTFAENHPVCDFSCGETSTSGIIFSLLIVLVTQDVSKRFHTLTSVDNGVSGKLLFSRVEVTHEFTQRVI